MNNKSMFRKTLLAGSIAMLTACGGGGSQTAATGTTSGVITGFGSIIVNGVHYDVDSADVSIDGVPGVESSLAVGDVVVLQGSSINANGRGTARAVSANDELEGYVLDLSDLSAGVGTINVMGQTVTITLDTIFDGDDTLMTTISDLNLNDIVEVSGFSDGNGGVFATRIEAKDAFDDVEIKGLISNLDETAETFTIGSLTIDYSSATELPSLLENALLVEVKTDVALTGDLNNGFVMTASKVEIEEIDDIDGDEGDEIEVQGLISGVDLEAGTFIFNGQTILIADLDDDVDTSLIVNGALITAEGYIDAAGNFVFEEIEEEHASDDEVEGVVFEVTETTVTVTHGVAEQTTFIINSDTRMIDEQDEGSITPVRYFSLADVSVGEFVEIKFYVDASTQENIATELEREDAPVEGDS